MGTSDPIRGYFDFSWLKLIRFLSTRIFPIKLTDHHKEKSKNSCIR
jgi:hypothetical protein